MKEEYDAQVVFADIPADIKQQLKEVEKHKALQKLTKDV